ncbi:MAG: hypothetical protein V1678_03080 [Candidatus Aenigmatarchaeota archaeon]
MKATMKFSMSIAVGVILLIITIMLGTNLVLVDTVQASGAVAPKISVKCTVNSDCSTSSNGHLCMVINNQDGFCGCVEDLNCGGGKSCVYNACK